jgi:DNA replicative helicase MCM subunit Mcm2 (Cdc46/Mcm family)
MADMALDDAGVFKALGLIPRPAKELTVDEQARTGYNVMQLLSSIAVVQKELAEGKKSMTEFQKEILCRLAEQQLSSPASSASLNLNTTADILRLKKLMADSRDTLSKLTGVVNGLVNIPASLANIEHVVQELRTGQVNRQMSLIAHALSPHLRRPASLCTRPRPWLATATLLMGIIVAGLRRSSRTPQPVLT